jgi:hypothetical protein
VPLLQPYLTGKTGGVGRRPQVASVGMASHYLPGEVIYSCPPSSAGWITADFLMVLNHPPHAAMRLKMPSIMYLP